MIRKPFSAAQIFSKLDRVIAGAPKQDLAVLDKSPVNADALANAETLAELAALIGDAKVRALLASLAASLKGRFDCGSDSAEGRGRRVVALQQASAGVIQTAERLATGREPFAMDTMAA